MFKRVGKLLAATFCMIASVLVMGQTTGAISGKVVDDKGEPVPGAVITVSGKALQGTKGGATNVDGDFMIPQLPPGPGYEISIEAEGFNKVQRSGITVSLGGNITMTIALNPGGQTVTVTGTAPVIDMKETKVSTNISAEEMNILPLPRRYQDTLYLAPSVVDSGMGRGNPGVSGSTGTENTFVINGLNTTDPVTGTFGSNLNFNFIQEMEITNGGFEAEYGASTGGLFNVITKSGSNEFHGELFAYFSNQNFNAKSQMGQSEYGPVMQSTYTYDAGFDIGGPIIKDKLWFFVGYNPLLKVDHYEGTKTAINTNTLTTPWTVRAIMPVAYDYKEERKNNYWSTKFNYRINDKQSLELSIFSDPAHFRNSDSLYGYYGALSDIPLKSRRFQDGVNMVLRWYASWTPKIFTEASIGRQNSPLWVVPADSRAMDTPQIISYDWGYEGDLFGYILSDGYGAYTQDRRIRDQFSFKLTAMLGKHEFKTGVDWEGLEALSTSTYSGGYLVTLDTLSVGSDLFDANPADYSYSHKYYYENPRSDINGEYEAFFVQDKWSATDFLNLSLGFRFERERYSPKDGYKLKVDNENYMPRMGFTWDAAHNGKSKIYASYGYFTERIPLGFASALENGHGMFEQTWINGGWGAPQSIYPSIGDVVQPGVKAPYKKEFIVGAEYELSADWSIGARAVYRTLGRVFEDVEYPTHDSAGVINGTAYILMNPGEYWPSYIMDWWGPADPLLGGDYSRTGYNDYMMNGFPKPKQFYKALQITLNKRFSNNWFLNVYYTLSRLEGDTSGGGYDSLLNPGMNHTSPDYDIPSWYLYRNKYGLLSTDHTHVLQAQGGVKLQNGIIIGATFQLQSGTPLSKICSVPDSMYYDAGNNPTAYAYGTMFLTPRGSEGRTPTTWTLDVHAEYTFKLKKTSLGCFVDVFNLTNNQRPTAYNQTYLLTGYSSDYGEVYTFTPSDPTLPNDPHAFVNIVPGPNSINPHYHEVTARQSPRTARIGIRWTF